MKTDEMRALAKKVNKARRRATTKGLLKWPGEEKGKPRKKGDYIHECTYLGGTSIALASTYEGHVEDCEWVETACNEAPQMAAALESAAAEIEAWRKAARALLDADSDDSDRSIRPEIEALRSLLPASP